MKKIVFITSLFMMLIAFNLKAQYSSQTYTSTTGNFQVSKTITTSDGFTFQMSFMVTPSMIRCYIDNEGRINSEGELEEMWPALITGEFWPLDEAVQPILFYPMQGNYANQPLEELTFLDVYGISETDDIDLTQYPLPQNNFSYCLFVSHEFTGQNKYEYCITLHINEDGTYTLYESLLTLNGGF